MPGVRSFARFRKRENVIFMIYLVEDDDSIRELMAYTLNASGYRAEGFESAESFWHAIERYTSASGRDSDVLKPELIMLDIMLPEEDGIQILKKLKSDPKTRDIPVIMETAKGQEYDKVIGLDLGADDYMSKPFGMMEMLARIRAVLRRTAPDVHKAEADELVCGNIRLSKSKYTVTVSGEPINLTLKEYDLLFKLMESPGRVFTREQLLSAVWGTDFMGETRTVDVHVGTLRTKLGDSGNMIETVRGVGYRISDIRR